jgi:hypothetical protein
VQQARQLLHHARAFGALGLGADGPQQVGRRLLEAQRVGVLRPWRTAAMASTSDQTRNRKSRTSSPTGRLASMRRSSMVYCTARASFCSTCCASVAACCTLPASASELPRNF